jgi:hypothetical protein
MLVPNPIHFILDSHNWLSSFYLKYFIGKYFIINSNFMKGSLKLINQINPKRSECLSELNKKAGQGPVYDIKNYSVTLISVPSLALTSTSTIPL